MIPMSPHSNAQELATLKLAITASNISTLPCFDKLKLASKLVFIPPMRRPVICSQHGY
jgi:hypothetical protein